MLGKSSTAGIRRQLALNSAAQVASATKVNKWRRWLWRRSQESGAMSNYTYSGQNDQQSGNYRHGWNSGAIPKKKSGRAIWWSHGLCDGDFTETAKDLHRQEYVAASDTVVACIQDRSDKLDIPCFVHYYLESLLMRHVRRGITDYEDLDAHCHLWQQMERWISFTWMSTFCYSSSGSDCIMSQVNGRTSAVYSRHSCSECCIWEIVEWATTSQKHHDAAGTYVWTISGHASSVDGIHWRVEASVRSLRSVYLSTISLTPSVCYSDVGFLRYKGLWLDLLVAIWPGPIHPLQYLSLIFW